MRAVADNDGVRVERAQSCYLCGEFGEDLYEGMRDRLFSAPGRWNLLRCPHCSLVWLDPRPVPDDIWKLYSTSFPHAPPPDRRVPLARLRSLVASSLRASALGYGSDGANIVLGALLARIGPLKELAAGMVMWLHASRRGRLLDVGCGSGEFLARMRDHGWKVVGVEPDEAAARVARDSFGLEAHCGTLDDVDLPESSFGAVTMSHVLEHAP